MIKIIEEKDYLEIKNHIEKEDIARNYFILLGLLNNKKVYERIYGEYEDKTLKAALFLRKSGLLQFFAPKGFNFSGFEKIIYSLKADKLIGVKQYCHELFNKGIFSIEKKGAYISVLDKDSRLKPLNIKHQIEKLNIEDLEEVTALYGKVFSGFSPIEVMKEKLVTKRGRGICVKEKGRIIAVAQTDFETEKAALIVGVATDYNHRCKGLATECTYYLSKELLEQKKNVFLQYDNPEAGRIYDRLGYKIIDQVMHYQK